MTAATTIRPLPSVQIQGSVALYAGDPRWRRAVVRGLTGTGHGWRDASSPADLRRLLLGQRFDVLVLKVRDDNEARALSRALEDVKLPLHTILVGNVTALPLLPRRRSGTFRFVPGRLAAQEVGRLVDVSISAGAGEDWSEENGVGHELEELDLEDAIDRAAAAVYPDASRKRQRFHSRVVGPDTRALADPLRLRAALTGLLRLTVSLAPYRALISVDAQAGHHEWLVRIRARHNGRPSRRPAHVAEALQQETKTLAAISRAVAGQGGVLWVELAGPAAPAFSMTLALPEGAQTASA